MSLEFNGSVGVSVWCGKGWWDGTQAFFGSFVFVHITHTYPCASFSSFPWLAPVARISLSSLWFYSRLLYYIDNGMRIRGCVLCYLVWSGLVRLWSCSCSRSHSSHFFMGSWVIIFFCVCICSHYRNRSYLSPRSIRPWNAQSSTLASVSSSTLKTTSTPSSPSLTSSTSSPQLSPSSSLNSLPVKSSSRTEASLTHYPTSSRARSSAVSPGTAGVLLRIKT